MFKGSNKPAESRVLLTGKSAVDETLGFLKGIEHAQTTKHIETGLFVGRHTPSRGAITNVQGLIEIHITLKYY